MDTDDRKEQLENLKIEASVAKRFRHYCKDISKSQSMTLLLMIEFFENKELSPSESIGPQIQSLENLIKKRINGVIAIIKDIEKNQTKPTVAMMYSLLEEAGPKSKPLVLENNDFKEDIIAPEGVEKPD